MNIYGKYRKYIHVRDAVWQTLIDFEIKSIPVQLSAICKASGIKLLKNSIAHRLQDNEFGISIKQGDVWYIVFNDSDNLQRARFTIAHELGHIFLGHEMLYGYHTRKSNISKPTAETEADMFAARLLAPTCVLWGLNLHTPQEIAQNCNISMEAAKIRAERMEILYKRNMFLSHPLERQVYKQFEDYIKNNRQTP